MCRRRFPPVPDLPGEFTFFYMCSAMALAAKRGRIDAYGDARPSAPCIRDPIDREPAQAAAHGEHQVGGGDEVLNAGPHLRVGERVSPASAVVSQPVSGDDLDRCA